MRGKEDLFHLIQSLSKSEKRYFTLDAQKSGRKSSRYLELFQAINKQEAYDELSLKKKFGKSLADDKSRLYEAILRSMRDYRSAKSYAARIKEMLLDAKFLYERGLYRQCEERLQLAKDLAYDLGDNLAVLEVNKEQRRLLKDTRPKGYDEHVKRMMGEKESHLTALVEEFRYLDIHDKLLMEVIRNPQRIKEQRRQEVKEEYYSLRDAPEPTSLQAKLRYHQSLAFLYQILGEKREVYNEFSEVIRCWNEHPLYKQEEFYRYILDASNLLHAAFSNPVEFLHEVPVLLENLTNENPTSYHDQKMLFQQTTIYRLLYHINTGDFKDIKSILEDIDKGLDTYNIHGGVGLGILFNASLLLFLSTNFKECNFWISKIIEGSRKTSLRQDIRDDARILQLFTAYEIGQVDFFDSTIRSVSRYFSAREESESKTLVPRLITILRKAFYAPEVEAITILAQIGKQLIDGDRRLSSGLDELILLWLKSKTEGISMERQIKGE